MIALCEERVKFTSIFTEDLVLLNAFAFMNIQIGAWKTRQHDLKRIGFK